MLFLPQVRFSESMFTVSQQLMLKHVGQYDISNHIVTSSQIIRFCDSKLPWPQDSEKQALACSEETQPFGAL